MKGQDNSIDNIKLITNRLVEIKYLHLVRSALEIAKRVRYMRYSPNIIFVDKRQSI